MKNRLVCNVIAELNLKVEAFGNTTAKALIYENYLSLLIFYLEYGPVAISQNIFLSNS